MRTRAVLLAAAVSVALGAAAQSISIPDAFTRADKGNCLSCHALPAPLAQPGGDVGPALMGTRMRELGAAQLRDMLDDPMRANANTAMPPFGRHRILDATEIAAIVRFLGSLPDGEPGYAQPPSAIDETAMHKAIERGQALWTRRFKDKRSLSGCFPNGGRRAAAVHPQYDARVKRVVTLEMAINQCLKVHHEKLLDPLESDMAAIVAYARSLGHGQKLNVRVPTAAQSRLDEGRRLYFTRMGQRNFACASCHTQASGKRYGAVVLPPAKGLVATTGVGTDGKPLTLQARMRQCLERMGAAPFPAGSDELNHLEYYLARESNGMPLAAPR